MMKRNAAILPQVRWFAGVVCLVAYLCGASGALPELCALAASSDRSHTPFFAVRDSGMTLVLSHARNGVSNVAKVPHRHGIIARGLCVLANPNSISSDHRVEFASCGTLESPQGKVRLTTPTTQPTSVLLPPPLINPLAAEASFFRQIQTSSGISESLLSTRFTVLLI
jgi:hypothetical protein